MAVEGSSRYRSVRTWLTTLTNSHLTKEKYTYAFGMFLEITDLNPDQIVDEWERVETYKDEKRFTGRYSNTVQDYYAMLCSNGYAPLTTSAMVNPVISFFNFHRMPIYIKRQKNVYVKYHNKDIEKRQIRRMLEHSEIREKAFYLILAESGLRPNTVVQLKYQHIKDDFEANRIPMKIEVPAELLKDRVGHRFTFIGEDGYNALKEYLSIRGTIADDDYLFTERKKQQTKPYLSTTTFSNFFRQVARKLKLTERGKFGKPQPLRLYCLRKYYYNNIDAPEIYKKFWAGWSLGTQGHYITRDVEKHREIYKEAYPSLRIYQPETNEEVEELREELESLKELVHYMRSDEYILKKFKEILPGIFDEIVEKSPKKSN